MPSRSYRIGRSVTGLNLFATKQIKRGAYIATYRGRRITTEESDRREARRQVHVRAQQVLGDRRVTAMECGTLHKPLLSAECKAGGSQRRDVIVALRQIGPDEEITYHYGAKTI
jgi:SET domain-containing protein